MSAVAAEPAAEVERPPLRVKRKRWTAYILPVFTVGMIVYLASPVFIMILFSFNDLVGERQIAEFTCCTMR
jgi:ABC-type spermidine/putrescine transport system permease subunit II